MRYYITRLFTVAGCLMASSCSMNKAFLAPEKLPADLSKIKINNTATGEVMVLHIGKDFQPTFTDKNDKPVSSSVNVEGVSFSGASGNKLYGWYITPKANALPVSLLFMHGNGGNILGWYPRALALAKKGFSVFIFDYSGYGLSSGKATRDNVLKDAQAALDHLRSRKETQGKKIIIYGQSLGGHAATVLAERNQQYIDALVTEGAFSSHKDIAAQRIKVGFIARLLVAEKYSATQSIRKFHKPVLIIHSTEDRVIPYRMGKKLFANANEPKSFYTIQHPHVDGPLYYADSITNKIMDMTTLNNF